MIRLHGVEGNVGITGRRDRTSIRVVEDSESADSWRFSPHLTGRRVELALKLHSVKGSVSEKMGKRQGSMAGLKNRLEPIEVSCIVGPFHYNTGAMTHGARVMMALFRKIGGPTLAVGVLVAAAACAETTPSVEPGLLLQTVKAGQTETVIDLLTGGADVNERDNAGETPLMAAALTGRQEIAGKFAGCRCWHQ